MKKRKKRRKRKKRKKEKKKRKEKAEEEKRKKEEGEKPPGCGLKAPFSPCADKNQFDSFCARVSLKIKLKKKCAKGLIKCFFLFLFFFTLKETFFLPTK